jgi:amidohydrolase
VVSAVQSIISRNLKPTDTAVITFGKFTAGKAVNVIPEEAYIGGTIRTFEKDVRDLVVQRMKEIIQGTEKTFQVTCRLEFGENLPTSVNDEKISSFLYSVSEDVLGPNNVRYIPPVTGSEDFAYFTIQRPSAMIRLGCRNEEKGITHMLHSPHFDIDEGVLLTGVRIFTEAIRQFLA